MKKYIVALSAPERRYLTSITKTGTHHARVIIRARILLLSHQKLRDNDIARRLEISSWTVRDVRKRYRQRATIQAALQDLPRSGQPSKLTPEAEAFIVATACTNAPDGADHWPLRALREAVNATYKTSIMSLNPIRAVLIQNELKPWREKNVVRPQAHAALPGTDGRHPGALH
ncbi:MAG: hypothetical protein A3E37_04905 [Candidatus Andersenbacteria bacterium RIFCSPHIGHO2_12_FULL_46_9]|nr:MAG: hypothetical protein A3B76_04030 [Candidatus Andersenbacteria bacterium RIFCSPHIGHO2_02_FULL_46_16]OGY36304.1 MAG: hypothetical protein A3E37_04905 [Candidatus Andersenbacteria bacterium RIFCSPHIGHO2_12_FULL_46_9]HBE89774.1 hypothetical protein [Candidatus Andersenbacteria bacterium]